MFKIVEFINSNSLAVVPINWIKNNEVKWHENSSPIYSKKGLFPKNKWKSYKVKIMTSKKYDSYEEANLALSQIILLDKTDIETDDMEPALISDTFLTTINKPVEFLSSDTDEGFENPLSVIKVTENIILKSGNAILPAGNTTQNSNDNEKSFNINNSVVAGNIFDQNLAFPDECIEKNIEFSEEYNNNCENNTNNYILMPAATWPELLKKMEHLQITVDKILSQNPICKCNQQLNISQKKFISSELLPLENIEKLIEFEEKLSTTDDLKSDFKQYLLNRLTTRDLRSVTKIIISKVYSLDVQSKINFTGVKGKTGIKTFISTDLILQVIYEYVPELIMLTELDDKIGKAEAEFMYQLQHFYDRKRSMQRRNNSLANKLNNNINSQENIPEK